MTVPLPEPVAAAFAAFPEAARERLLAVRDTILRLAEETATGPLTETLKWGQPAYLTEATEAGSTIRLGMQDDRPAVFFICNTSLVDGFRSDFPDALDYVGNRAVLLDADSDMDALEVCLSRALRYHLDRRSMRA